MRACGIGVDGELAFAAMMRNNITLCELLLDGDDVSAMQRIYAAIFRNNDPAAQAAYKQQQRDLQLAQEQQRQAEAARLQRQQAEKEEIKKRAEQEAERKRVEDQRKREEEEARKRAANEEKKRVEEQRKKEEEERKRWAQQEAERKRVEDQRKKEEEQARKKAAEEEKKRVEEQRKKEEEERKRRAQQEAERKRVEDQRKREEEEARKRAANEEKKRAEEQRKKEEEERRKKKAEEEEEKRRAAEAQLDSLLAGLAISSKARAALVEQGLVQRDLLCGVTQKDLTTLKLTVGEALAIKLRFPSVPVVPDAPLPVPHAPSRAPIGPLAPMPAPPQSFAVSNFKRMYDTLRPLEVHYKLFEVVHRLITIYCLLFDLALGKGDTLFAALSREAMAVPDELLDEVDAASQRMWTTKLELRGCGDAHRKEFCSILNFAIRCDHPDLVAAAAQLARNINRLVVTRRKDAPPHPPNSVCFRGSSLPDVHHAFFTVGRKYRVPGFLATSFSVSVAKKFMYNTHQLHGVPVVLWRIHLDPRAKSDFDFVCKHVNYIGNSASHVAGEDELLFAPYSVFTVQHVEWNAGDDRKPHVIDLVAAIDNRDEPEDLALAPWY